MKKLSTSQSSKKHLEQKMGICSEELSKDVQEKLTEASEESNKKIAYNNSVYQQSNHRSHLYPVVSTSHDRYSQYMLDIQSDLEYHSSFYQRYLIEKENHQLNRIQEEYSTLYNMETSVELENQDKSIQKIKK